MAVSLLARTTASYLTPSHLIYANCAKRAIHSTSAVLKKKAKVEIEDLFSDDLVKTEAFSNSPSSEAANALNANTSSSTSKSRIVKKGKLSVATRAARFDKVLQFMSPRLGRKPITKMPLVRKSAWAQLLQLATTEAQIEHVVEMFPKWQESGYQFDDALSELFVRRCEELSCPLLALKVYGNYSKYNLPLSLPAARHLLHSLHLNYPIDNVMTAAALYSVYNLPTVNTDLISCSLLLSACYAHNSKDSLQIAKKLVISLEKTLAHTEPRPLSDSPAAGHTARPWVWVNWALKRIDKVLSEKQGKRVDWLSLWREQSGSIVAPSRP